MSNIQGLGTLSGIGKGTEEARVARENQQVVSKSAVKAVFIEEAWFAVSSAMDRSRCTPECGPANLTLAMDCDLPRPSLVQCGGRAEA